MFLALWGLRSVIWLSSRNESADQPVPGVDIVLGPCQVPANLLKNLDQKNWFFRLTPFAYDPFWGYATHPENAGLGASRCIDAVRECVNKSAASAASPDYINFQAVIKSAAGAACLRGGRASGRLDHVFFLLFSVGIVGGASAHTQIKKECACLV